MTTTNEVTQKCEYLEEFDCVAALYSVLKTNSATMCVNKVKTREERIDFVLDVEVKVKRVVGQRLYDTFLRAVYNENLEILSEFMREALGKTFFEHGLGPSGAYAKLYFNIKNAQVRSYMSHKKEQNGIFRADDGIDNIIAG